MHTLLAHKRLLAAALLFIFATFLAASFYIQNAQSEYVLKTQLKIAEQETKLAGIAELTGRDGADAVVEEIIQDCSQQNRERFDTLLGKLSQLHGSELSEVEQLFNACGNFFAERKAVMVARLEREYEVYTDLVDILTLYDEKAPTVTYDIEGWNELVDMEKKRSELSTRLVQVQGDIIQALRSGTAISSEEMQLLLAEGQQTKDTLSVLSLQIEQKRQAILKL